MEQSPRALGSSSGKLMLQKPSLSNKQQSAHPDSASKIPSLIPANQGTKIMSTFRLPQMENLAQIAIPPNLGHQQLASKNKRKSPTEKSPKPQNVFSAHQAAILTNRRASPAEKSLKARNESFESVRSKLRESLASALVLGSGEKAKPLDVEKSYAQETKPKDPITVSQQGDISSTSAPPETPLDPMGRNHDVAHKSDASSFAGFVSIGENADNVANTRDSFAKEEDTPFNDFALKDDLLQENGLCWVADVGPERSESRDGGASKRAKLDPDEIAVDPKESEDRNRALAASIEAELFRLFGGVNKKYKEKGRSLLFNLKDPSNPELRERVISGEITPQRLCSMSAEELASKELTEWRIAKAEEFAHMVVLPDSDVDLRRVVKKTHKGEFQVEVERDDSGSVEVAIGANSLPLVLPRRASEPKSNSKSVSNSKPNEADGSDNSGLPENADSEALELSSNLTTLPHDMQDLIVDVKGAENLPPIVSLDEFMEALDSEPPFENLSGGAEQHPQTDDGGAGSSDAQVDTSSGKPDGKPDATPSRTLAGDPLDASASQPDEIEAKAKDADAEDDPAVGTSKADAENPTPTLASNGGHLWEGVIQLNISSLVTVLAVFRSGEKVSTKDWPTFVEVKGRVRVEAFEKFLRDLPLSKSRAMMVVDLRWKEGSPEGGLRAISEAVESYVADGRLGYVEPCPGVELYVCPPGGKTAQMLGEHAAAVAEPAEAAAPAEGGLVGVVVWRRALVESPRLLSSSHHHHHQKHSSSSKRSSLSRKQQQRPLPGSLTREPPAELNPKPRAEDAGEDLPPGFGPAGAGAGEEDDLPEFDFRRGSLPAAAAPRPAYHMRELIHKYGQGEGAAAVAGRVQLTPARPWEDDDDDDIPEWRPQTVRPHPPQQAFLPHLTNQRQQQQQFIVPPPPEHPQFLPRAAAQPGGWGPYGGRPMDGQGFAAGDQRSAMDWRYDVPRSRGL
ncbi:unnamed protein product [Spirodela intermedia]|uniref:TFIIS central domain-containing protein n=1 Tax=Spirodela intermedia TaxID=51605 RepID=A0A7I8LKW3_SPIIN|nr:unnamed protein product [Spirodela intermedia]